MLIKKGICFILFWGGETNLKSCLVIFSTEKNGFQQIKICSSDGSIFAYRYFEKGLNYDFDEKMAFLKNVWGKSYLFLLLLFSVTRQKRS